MGDDYVDMAIHEAYRSGLPEDLPGTLVVIKVLVNEYTTKRELEEAWRQISAVKKRYGQAPHRTRAGQTLKQYMSWLPAYEAHRLQWKSLNTVADEFATEEVETLRYRIGVLDDLFARPKNTHC